MIFVKSVCFSVLALFFVACGSEKRVQLPTQEVVEKKRELPRKVKNPYENVSESEKITAYTNYFIKKALYTQKPSFPSKPQQPSVPKAKELVKGKYENTKGFELRVKNERKKRAEKLKGIEKSYANKVKEYNTEVKKRTDSYNNTVAHKQKNIQKITSQAMANAYATVYGKPFLENNLKYDADNEIFYGNIKSSKGGFSESVAIKVPLSQAENFERNIGSLKTEVVFDFSNERLSLKKILLQQKKKSYIAQLDTHSYQAQDVRVAINGGSLNLPSAPLLSASLAIDANAYNVGSINYSKDPEIAKLQKRKFELERKTRQKAQSVKREAELKKQREALESQIALLEQKKGGFDDISGLLKKAQGVKTDSKKWLFIVAIENYEYTDPVAYSANSAKQFKKVMQKRLGITEKNTRTLINKNATSGKIRHNLKDMLRHVKKGDSIYFYYSGHGIPVPSQNNSPYLLAQDMSPEYVSDDSRFKLQNIYKSLSDSKARSVVVFADSCFSGGTDNQALIKGVAATRLKPKQVTFDKQKMIVISAGSGTQYSNKYDEKSNRLFSYYVMRGLMKNNTDIQRLYDYVKSNVQEKSYEMGSSYEQVPVYEGAIGMGL